MENEATTSAKSTIRSEFDALPLEEKFIELFRLEARAIEEALTYVLEQPLRALEKFGDAIENFGERVETKAKNAAENVKEKREAKRTRNTPPATPATPPPTPG
jgi:hypothetical protein